jgi:hypothetical protein
MQQIYRFKRIQEALEHELDSSENYILLLFKKEGDADETNIEVITPIEPKKTEYFLNAISTSFKKRKKT